MLVWKKDLNSVYLSANNNCAKLFGFKNTLDIVGTTDFEIRSKFVELAPVFQECDKQVILASKPLRLLEILKCNGDEWKIFLVTKVPLLNEINKPVGTIGHTIDVTVAFIKIGIFLSKRPSNRKTNRLLQQSSYVIGEKNNAVNLTPRQSECLFHILRGKTTKNIAKLLHLSPRTVEEHIAELKYKFGCKSKAELIDTAIANGFLNVVPPSIFKSQFSIELDTE
ncbi:MAG: PAS domain-containing protein [Coxiellaceae bacterium]|nr:MAG: PAS domain-containing protein [Coxiellaceae bacterium]